MSIAAEVLRLTAVEALAPTASLVADNPVFPTLAGRKIFDSRAITLGELDREAAFTPCLSLYTRSSGSKRRGNGQGSVDRNASTVLEVVAELAIGATDEASSEPFADAMAGDDPQARIVLAALCAQVRHALTIGATGALFRRICMAIDDIEEEPFAVPHLGLRWQRTTMLFSCQIPDDDFSAAGLPQPAGLVASLLPDTSYARAKIDQMAVQFVAPAPLPTIETIQFALTEDGIGGLIEAEE